MKEHVAALAIDPTLGDTHDRPALVFAILSDIVKNRLLGLGFASDRSVAGGKRISVNMGQIVRDQLIQRVRLRRAVPHAETVAIFGAPVSPRDYPPLTDSV